MNLAIDTSRIASRTKIATLSTGAWRAKVRSASESAAVNAKNGSGDAATVIVKLLDGGTHKAILSNHMAAYEEHVRLTMPTIQKGMRLVPAGRELEHSRTMQKYADIHNALLRKFLGEYASLKAKAPASLGPLFDATQWPDEHTIADKFHFSTRYLATPSEGQWGDWLRETAMGAVEDFRGQLREALERVAEKVGNGGKLYDTVFSNLRDLVELSTDMNIANDPFIARIATLAAPLAESDAELVRDDKAARKEIATQAKSILSYFGKA